MWNGEMLRLYIKSWRRNAVNKRWCLGTATQDKCEMTLASPGPISSLIEMEHKFSVSRTKILLSGDDSWLMVHHRILQWPCWPDWQVEPRSPGCCWWDYTPHRWGWVLRRFQIRAVEYKNNWCLGLPENRKSVHWWHPAINLIHRERLGATLDL